jgi:hypothetical protein
MLCIKTYFPVKRVCVVHVFYILSTEGVSDSSERGREGERERGREGET